jgi:hypothetical protein
VYYWFPAPVPDSDPGFAGDDVWIPVPVPDFDPGFAGMTVWVTFYEVVKLSLTNKFFYYTLFSVALKT